MKVHSRDVTRLKCQDREQQQSTNLSAIMTMYPIVGTLVPVQRCRRSSLAVCRFRAFYWSFCLVRWIHIFPAGNKSYTSMSASAQPTGISTFRPATLTSNALICNQTDSVGTCLEWTLQFNYKLHFTLQPHLQVCVCYIYIRTHTYIHNTNTYIHNTHTQIYGTILFFRRRRRG